MALPHHTGIMLRLRPASVSRSQRDWPVWARGAWAPQLAMARNPAARPAIQLALILGLAFIESLVLFTLVIIFAKVV